MINFFIECRNEEERNKQVVRPIYQNHVSSWYGLLRLAVPHALERSRAHAPMLAVLGYTLPANDKAKEDSGNDEMFDRRYGQLERNYQVSNWRIGFTVDYLMVIT